MNCARTGQWTILQSFCTSSDGQQEAGLEAMIHHHRGTVNSWTDEPRLVAWHIRMSSVKIPRNTPEIDRRYVYNGCALSFRIRRRRAGKGERCCKWAKAQHSVRGNWFPDIVGVARSVVRPDERLRTSTQYPAVVVYGIEGSYF